MQQCIEMLKFQQLLGAIEVKLEKAEYEINSVEKMKIEIAAIRKAVVEGKKNIYSSANKGNNINLSSFPKGGKSL